MAIDTSVPIHIASHEDDITALAAFVDHLRKQGVRSYVGKVPLASGAVDINVTFDREQKKPHRNED
jgi:hypothetical protein